MNFDIIFENAEIYDGTGRVPYNNDVGIKAGKIAAIGNLKAGAGKRIKADDLCLCPGFIDVHSHADMTIHHIDHAALLEPLVRQGITTFVGGNCGVAMAPISEQRPEVQHEFYDIFLGADQRPYIKWQSMGAMMETLETQGMLMNMGLLTPHGVLRMHAMADKITLASAEDIRIMKTMLKECMDAGALGMSTGLMYFPGLFSDTNELLPLANVLHEYNGVLTSHLRSYNSDTIEKAIDEILDLGTRAQIPVQLSHLFWIPNFPHPFNMLANLAIKGLSRIYAHHPFKIPMDSGVKPHLQKIDKLIQQGHPVGIDSMPTTAGFTHLFAFFPPWSLTGGVSKLLERIADPLERTKIRTSIEKGEPVWPHRSKDTWSMNLFKVMGWDCAFVMSVISEKNQDLVGKSFVEIGRQTGKHPFDAACDLALEENGRVLIFECPTYPGDPLIELSLKRTLTDPNVSIVTDAIMMSFGMPSHLFFDCYPKFLSQYTGTSMLSLAEAIRKCTSLPARQLQIKNRGVIASGNHADIVLFDRYKLKSNSTTQDPKHFPDGIEYVLINGFPVVSPEGFHPEPKVGEIVRR